MSLNYDLRNVKDYKTLCWREDGKDENDKQLFSLTKITEAIVFMTIAVGMGEITEKNHVEFFLRTQFCERLTGCYRMIERDGKPEDLPITLEEVRAHIGLKTNVSYESTAKFLKRKYSGYEQDARWSIRRREEEAAEKVAS